MSGTDDLYAFAVAVRAFLQPHWQAWHAAWGPPAPATSAQWTCIRSAAFLAFALRDAGLVAEMRSGRGVPGMANEQEYGFLVDGCWKSHAWICSGQHLIDITADQYGEPPVLITALSDWRYRAGTTEETTLSLTEKGARAVEEVRRLWPSKGR